MDTTMSTDTAPTSDSEVTSVNEETVDTTEEKEEAPQPAEGGESIEELKQRLASATDEADRAKRFIVNFVSERQSGRPDPESLPDPIGTIPANDVIEEFKENPIGLLDKHFATRMAPIVADNLEARARENRNRAIERLGNDTWSEYGQEIDRFMGGMSLHTRANPGSYEEALHFVRARNIDKEVEKRVEARMKQVENEKRGLVEGGGSRSGGSYANGRGPGMTEMEKSIAKGFGMSEKEWMKYKTPKARG
jgi:hypothetical protein